MIVHRTELMKCSWKRLLKLVINCEIAVRIPGFMLSPQINSHRTREARVKGAGLAPVLISFSLRSSSNCPAALACISSGF